jgi:hypothetical protein
MSDVLARIKRAVLAGRHAFSEKARTEMKLDGITELDVAESIINAVAIYKKLRSTSPRRQWSREYLYVIQSPNLDGLAIYTKGKFVREAGVLISSKKAL